MHQFWAKSFSEIKNDNEFWNYLSPNLKRKLSDVIFSKFFKSFDIFFDKCEPGFKRFIA
jgi:hypothetical protein